MDAKNHQLKTILDGTHQYMVPIYQRQYSWRQPQWEQLWADVVSLDIDAVEDRHFLGSIVSKAFDAKAGGISKYLLIDGQQRLTTITLLLAALRDLLRPSSEANAQQSADMIHELYLTNRFREGEDVFKVLPTTADRVAYFAHIQSSGTESYLGSSISQAYQFFRKSIANFVSDESGITLQALQSSITERMELVSITLGTDDNDYRIFESLNATGTPLTQTDLLRNFFLMRFDGNEQERIYKDIVRPITSDLNEVAGASSDTMFQYALQRTGAYVRDKDIYAGWKRRCEKQTRAELESTLLDLRRDANNYLTIVEPEREVSSEVALRLRNYSRLGIMTPTPFLLNVLRWREDGRIDDQGLIKIFDLIQSFLVRRMFSNIPTNALNRLFIRLVEQLPDAEDLVYATHVALSQPGLRWPTDDQFRQHFMTYQLYKDSRSGQRSLVLQTLERRLGHKEGPNLDHLDIEHIMPQTLTPEWRSALGTDSGEVHARWLHTIGNLTLTGYNSELSNDTFEVKRERYRQSNVTLTKRIADYDQWNETTIQDRAEWLFGLASAVWVGPLSL